MKKKKGSTKKKKVNGHGCSSLVASANPPSDVGLGLGDRVTLRGLKATEYNGKHGCIVSLPSSIADDGGDGRFGVRLEGSNKAIAVRAEHLVRFTGATANGTGRLSTADQLREREAVAMPPKEAANADEMQMTRMMMSMLPEQKQVALFGRKIKPMPNFYEELMLEGGGMPVGVNKAWGNHYLRTSFEQASGLPHLFETTFKRPTFKVDPCDLIKRIGTNDPRKLDWYFDVATLPGSIYPRTWYPYSSFMRHSFSNQLYRPTILEQGKTHVAVGFVDLGILFAATLRKPKQSTGAPLRFFGIEMSAYAVAKTHVIWEMLKATPSSLDSNAIRDQHLRSVMQAWFSVGWDETTHKAAKTALSSLCTLSSPYHPDVLELLTHWRDAPRLSLANSRSQRQKATTTDVSAIGHLERHWDRIAMAKYELSGDIGLDGKKPSCGNLLTFCCPDGTPPMIPDETVFSALDMKELISYLPNGTIMEAAESFIMAQLSKVADWATTQIVVVDLWCTKVEHAVQDIAEAKPWTMSWSNLPDYTDHADFHRMARACSTHGETIHVGYSMNWSIDVFGTNMLDYAGPDNVDFRGKLIDTGNRAALMLYTGLGWQKYLRLPPPTNPLNTISHFGLEVLHWKEWTNYFFDVARDDGPCQVADSEHILGSPLSPTGAGTIALTWTYDPDMKVTGCSK